MESYTTTSILNEITAKKPEDVTQQDLIEKDKTIITTDAYALTEAIIELTKAIRDKK